MMVLKWETLCDNDLVELTIPDGSKPPFVESSPKTINEISRGLNEQGIRHSVDEESIQLDDGPETLTLSMEDYRDTAYLQSVLDRIGRQIPPPVPHWVTIPGTFIVSDRFQTGARAMELLKIQCDEVGTDLSLYDLVVCLEPKGSRKSQYAKSL